MTVLIDSNVVIDLATNSEWADWAAERLEDLSSEPFAINQIVYAEALFSYRSGEDLDELFSALGIERLNLPWAAAFPASRAYRTYRERGGSRTSPLPDFYIGAHAQVAGLTLLTRDARRFRTYFPSLNLVAPD